MLVVYAHAYTGSLVSVAFIVC